MSERQLKQKITTLLEEEMSSVTQLHIVLKREYEALRTRNLEELDIAMRLKQELSTKLEKAEQEIFRLFDTINIKLTPKNIKQQIKNICDAENFEHTWTNLTTAIHACKQQNEINGRVINSARATTKTAFEILSGTIDSESTYGHDGKSDDNSNNGSIAIA